MLSDHVVSTKHDSECGIHMYQGVSLLDTCAICLETADFPENSFLGNWKGSFFTFLATKPLLPTPVNSTEPLHPRSCKYHTSWRVSRSALLVYGIEIEPIRFSRTI